MINLCVKKVFCPTCQKLVRVKQQKSGDKLQFTCIKCSKVVWQKEGLGWKYLKEEQ